MSKGLTKEKIVSAAIEIMRRNGFESFSLRVLAESLEVKAASLYKHFENMDELILAVSLKVYEEFDEQQHETVSKAKTRQEAMLALAMAYKDFAHTHPSFYHLLSVLPRMEQQELERVTAIIYAPIMGAINMYQLDDETKLHWTHIYFATVVGFMVVKGTGLSNCSLVNASNSFRLAIRNIISALESLEREQLARANYLRDERVN